MYKPSVELGLSPAVRSLEQRDHHLAMGEQDGPHGGPGHFLVGIFGCVETVEMFQRHLSASLSCVDC